LLELYVNQLNSIGIRFVRPFTMMTSGRRTIYDLIFATKNWKGMDSMKKAMLKVVSNGTYTFSDKTDTHQTYFVDYSEDSHWINDASDLIFKQFNGKEIPLNEIRDFILADTPFRFLKKVLVDMEKNGRITDVSDRTRKALTYSDNCTVKFSKNT